MMNEADLKRFIRLEVARQAQVILSGVTGANENVGSEDIEQVYPGSPTIEKRPVMHPYGFASKAPRGVLQVTARQGENPGNRMVMGHRDKNRPDDMAEGEAWTYSQGGWFIQCNNAGVKIVNKDADTSIDISTGEILFTAGDATGKFDSSGKFSFTGPAGEFVASIVKLFEDIQTAQTSTALGPQPLQMPTFPTDLTVLQAFKE